MEAQKEKIDALDRFAIGAAAVLVAQFESATKEKRMLEAVIFCADAICACVVLDDEDFTKFVERETDVAEIESSVIKARRDYLKARSVEYEQRRG